MILFFLLLMTMMIIAIMLTTKTRKMRDNDCDVIPSIEDWKYLLKQTKSKQTKS